MDDGKRFDGSRCNRRRTCQHCSIERRGLRRQRNFFLICCLILHSALFGAACSPRQQRSTQHFSATLRLNVIAPAVWAPQTVAALHSSSKFKQQRRRRLLVSRRYTAHGCMGNAWAAHVLPRRSSTPKAQRAAAPCVRRAPFFARIACRPHVPKGLGPVAGVVFKVSAASFRCLSGRNTGIQET